MGYIEEQIRELREISEMYEGMDGGEILKESADTIESLYKKLNERSNNGWIPCSERLPENYQDVLVSGENIVKQAQFIKNVFECEDPDFYAMLDDEKMIGREDATFKAIAWQPLPDSYKKEV